MLDWLEPAVDAALPDIVKLRHELHEHPEIRFEEVWTSDRISRFLTEEGIPHQRGYARGTGIVATLTGGAGRTVALRTDMDALEIEEQTGLPYASKTPKRMHACGHDGHMATLCGVARVLKQREKSLPGTVRLIFQPAEEIAGGAKYMVADGAVDGVDGIFALHGWPQLPLGVVGVKDGYMMASARDFIIEVRGKGCHGADPASGVDSILVAAHIATALQSLVSRETNPYDAAVVTIGRIQAGEATNVIPETAEMAGTFRWLDERVGERLAEGIARIATQTAAAFRATATVTMVDNTYPAVLNDPAMTRQMRETVRALLGESGIYEAPYPAMSAEDFSYYQQKTPGAFVWLGVNPRPETAYPNLHSPHYDFPDVALPIGMKVMVGAALRFLNGG